MILFEKRKRKVFKILVHLLIVVLVICKHLITRLFTGKQAVVVSAIENQHMPEDLIMEPGLVMIFAHGVE